MKKIIIIVLLISVFTRSYGQSGVNFEIGLNWQQVLAKAKQENKCIFVDCYATWCGPCKAMDKVIYPLKEVGDFFNSQFISVKLQMDKTSADNANVRKLYPIASDWQAKFAISAYPTFLVFDPNGNPVHKTVGGMNPKQLIAFAADAQNPKKQYFTIVKNFQPGKLDTAELKGLARIFINSDRQLAGKMAADYLSRIPQRLLAQADNGKLMVQFEYNQRVADITAWYIQIQGVKANIALVESLSKQPEIEALAASYITELDKNEFDKNENLKLAVVFKSNSTVEQAAKNYIDHLSESELYTSSNIEFLSYFTTKPQDRGFKIFYDQPDKVDVVMGQNGYANAVAETVIKETELTPLMNTAEEKVAIPNFDDITAILTTKYNADFAKKIVLNGKISWYLFLINNKKEEQYWPELITCRINQVKCFGLDTMKAQTTNINQICWIEIFHHCNDINELNIAVKWLEQIIDQNPKVNSACLDTYACLLYKAGKLNEALFWEGKYLQDMTNHKVKTQIDYANNTIDKMKKGEKLWLEKDYQ